MPLSKQAFVMTDQHMTSPDKRCQLEDFVGNGGDRRFLIVVCNVHHHFFATNYVRAPKFADIPLFLEMVDEKSGPSLSRPPLKHVREIVINEREVIKA
jgi:hypothetical protein